MDAHKVYEVATGLGALVMGVIWTKKDLLNAAVKVGFFVTAIAAVVLAFR